ncbi:MAG: vitamin K epoxide reductase, partial [Actinobacteria bacterium]|nr:vitamin K epoxide reductase [Actinomycetota bacterium]
MSDRALRSLTALVAFSGIAIAGYLTLAHYRGNAVACPIGGGCETVQSSEYAELAGVPVALLGLSAYAVMLGLLAWD